MSSGTDKRYAKAHAYMPAGWPEKVASYEEYIDLMKRWCSLIKVAHGTAGFSIIFEEGQPKLRDGRLAFPFIKRFPGLDYPDSSQWNARGVDKSPTRVIRSINWLTAIDDGFVTELGGLATVTAALGPDCRVHRYEGGIIIQAGDRPQLGDVNRGLVLDAYRAVARVLKPLRFEAFHPKYPYIYVNRPLDSREETLKWLARFD
ncbi:MAG: type VI immunity family protein [Janthinobacterium lividum]